MEPSLNARLHINLAVNYNESNEVEISLIMSLTLSMPTDKKICSAEISAAASSLSVSWRCIVDAG